MNVAGALAPPPRALYAAVVDAALAEDFGIAGDITSDAVIAADAVARASFVAREAGVVAGLDAALYAVERLDPQVAVRRFVRDGDPLERGTVLATVEGRAHALLGAERTALNVLSHASGIASTTARYVAACAGYPCRIVETRKTLPGLRAIEKYAVRAGGGHNHRLRLDDAILIKDNHIAIAGGIGIALERARSRAGHLVKIEIEVDSLAQLDEVLAHPAAADVILLDNFSLRDLREAVGRTARRAVLEASGGVTLEQVPQVAATGVDVISVGALTHSVRALDIGLDIA